MTPFETLPPRRRFAAAYRSDVPSPVGFLVTLGFYALLVWSMLVLVVGLGVYLGFQYDGRDVPPSVLREHVIPLQIGIAVFDALVVAVAVAATWRPRQFEPLIPRAAAWAMGVPALAAMLAVNFGFVLVVQFLTGKPPEEDPTELTIRDGWLAVLLVCVQPAVVEEVFFRFLMLGHFRDHVGPHVAVFLSSVFFAAAHVGQVGGLPVLFLLGGVLGYARVCSGGLALPILIHFLHNLCVICVNPELT